MITMQTNESVKRKTRKRKYGYKINTSASLAVFKKKVGTALLYQEPKRTAATLTKCF